ncbi:MAG: amidohydrolase, partial [Planctomycetota bacterium]|nr:amidohydrolase [Planctomycetota bacterium]
MRRGTTRRVFLRVSTAGSAALIGGAALRPLAARGEDGGLPRADLLVLNGRVWTMDPARPRAEAIAVSGGRIVAVGTDREILRRYGPGTREIDAAGLRVIPGLNDSHCHAVRAGRFFNLELRWDGVRSLARGLEMIRQHRSWTPEGQWIRVIGGWSPYQFEERRMPTVSELNEAGGDTPVFVLYLYSQGFLNRAGVEALGLSERSEAPKGARYEFVDGGAVLHAEPNPMILYSTIARLPQLDAEDQLNSSRQYYRELSRFGVTSCIDAGGGGHVFPENYGATMELAGRDELPVRVSFHLFPQRPGEEYGEFRTWAKRNAAGQQFAARLNGLALEGGGEFLAWSAGDYENFMAAQPVQGEAMERDLEEIARFLVEIRWPIRIHATYDESITRILNVFEKIDRDTPFDGLRWAIDHAETISDANIERVKALGGGIAVQNRMAFAGEYFLERYGAERAASAPPLRRLVESGVPLGLGTDSTRVSSYNPWLSLAWAVTGKSVGGTQLLSEENRLSREEA